MPKTNVEKNIKFFVFFCVAATKVLFCGLRRSWEILTEVGKKKACLTLNRPAFPTFQLLDFQHKTKFLIFEITPSHDF